MGYFYEMAKALVSISESLKEIVKLLKEERDYE